MGRLKFPIINQETLEVVDQNPKPVFRPKNGSWYHQVMQKRFIPAFILIAYSAFLIKWMVFKEVPLVRVGRVMLNFGGTNAGHQPNFVPFKTILPYVLGHKGLIIAGINLVGNIILLVPIGFLAPFLYRNMTWKKSLLLAAATGLAIEVMQVVLRVGIFDIDDVILNAFGFMIGYWVFVILAKMARSMKSICSRASSACATRSSARRMCYGPMG